MDTIRVEGLEVFAHHGVYPEETKLGQKFLIDLTAFCDLHKAGLNDDLKASVSYGELARFASRFACENTFKLIEALAQNLAIELLQNYDIEGIKVTVEKPSAPIGLPIKNVSVTIERSWHKAYLSVGSNIGDRLEHIDNAIDLLNRRPDIEVTRVSSFIETKPYGNVEQDDFINGCFEIKTLLEPEELLKVINEIEAQEGRERKIHWGPRTLDLDIIFYDDLRYYTEKLQIPHRDMQNREFVLKPLCELIPYYIHPVYMKSVSELLSEVETNQQ